MSLISFFQATNVKTGDLSEGYPWDFFPAPERVAEVRSMKKADRRAWMAKESTVWNAYSCVRGTAANARCSKDNPPAGLRGLVVDYDMETDVDTVIKYLNQCAPEFLPNFIEITLSKNVRLVWVFEREILIPNNKFCRALIEVFLQKTGAPTLLSGYDDKSADPFQIWTNGGEWFTVKEQPMAWPTVFGILSGVSKKMEFGRGDIPLEIIAEEIAKRFPKRWQGPFQLNNIGLRFWDASADNPNGCQIKPDGMLCFTGHTGFMTWDSIFGVTWCNEQRATNVGKIAGETYFDGHNYWEMRGTLWTSVERQDVIMRLRTKGVSSNIPKSSGETASDADRVMTFIQDMNFIRGAAPLINQRPGIVTLDGNRILNISTVRALEPAVLAAVPERDFPWLWEFLNGLFDRPELNPLDYFLAWLQRAYAAGYHYRKAMGQAVFLCGPKENGKTLLCYKVIKPLLGDKMANPYDYFTGVTHFNSELFESPLLAINDEEATSRDETRQKFSARIKSFVVNPSHSYHPKFCNRISIEWTGRIFCTLNDDPNAVGLLPEKNDSTSDKLMFFASRPYGKDWEANYVIEARIEKELPFFARWLLDWSPPRQVVAGGRMGVKSYFDPRILELSQQQISAYNLLELLAEWMARSPLWVDTKEWTGTATSLINALDGFEEIKASMKEWNVYRATKALTSLARLNNSGVSIVPNSGERDFKLERALIVKTKATETV